MSPRYSVIIPVYNRPQEVQELLASLSTQTNKDFEIIIVEDGSAQDCKSEVEQYLPQLDIKYFYKENTGPGDSRNFGMSKAQGEYLIFFDSDCLIPDHYFEAVETALNQRNLDAYGGPDRAHESFTNIQKAINYAMTSFITTGGIRGSKQQLDRFQPRSFNMGLKQAVYAKIGGFSDVHPGEDPDLSYRIQNAGYQTGLIPEAFVYHKRRIDFSKFRTQVYKFGVARTILMKWHPQSFKKVYFFPSLALLGTLVLLVAGAFNPIWWWPLGIGLVILMVDALRQTKSMTITLMAVWATAVQIFGYGWGFLKGFWYLHILKKDARQSLPKMFFKG